MKIAGFNVYHAPEGSSESFLGFVPVGPRGGIKAALRKAQRLARRNGLEEALYDTARAAGHVCGMTAPDRRNEATEPYEWFGPQGWHCAVPVYEEGDK